MIQVSVSSNIEAVMREMLIGAEGMKDAARIALNKTAENLKVTAAREAVRVGYKVRVSVIKDGIRIKRATAAKLSTGMVASGKPIPLIEYAPRRAGSGVTVSVLRGRKLIEGAFMAIMKNGRKDVFVRAPNAKHRKVIKGGKQVWSALPIKKLYGPSVPDMLNHKDVERAIYQRVEEQYPKELRHEWQRLTNKLGSQQMRELARTG